MECSLIEHIIPHGVAILQYADDTIICLKHEMEGAVNMKFLLYMYEMMAGYQRREGEDEFDSIPFRFPLRSVASPPRAPSVWGGVAPPGGAAAGVARRGPEGDAEGRGHAAGVCVGGAVAPPGGAAAGVARRGREGDAEDREGAAGGWSGGGDAGGGRRRARRRDGVAWSRRVSVACL
ncbi:uncharacterized protein [Miscanthus floridulus]|uniref:uncharacterized protein n=1 Tax=Miscanthus floridulus TaxID=154761 RepID=UPI00345895DC